MDKVCAMDDSIDEILLVACCSSYFQELSALWSLVSAEEAGVFQRGAEVFVIDLFRKRLPPTDPGKRGLSLGDWLRVSRQS